MADNPRIEELRRRVQKDPASIAFAQLAEEYRRAGNYEDAVRVCRTGLAKHPSYLSARVTLGRALIEIEQYDEAQTELDYVLRSAPENLAAIRGLAEIHQRRGDLGEALKQYQAALGIAKHDPELEESVHELSRQLGPAHPAVLAAPPRPDVPPMEPRPVLRAGTGRLIPPPIPDVPPGEPDALAPTATSAPAPPAPDDSSLPGTPEPPLLSPELEAAADEFTRALEALDALALDLPTSPLDAAEIRLPEVPPALDAVEAAAPTDVVEPFEPLPTDEKPVVPPPLSASLQSDASVPSPAGAAPDPDADTLHDLESWLGNIVADRPQSTKRS